VAVFGGSWTGRAVLVSIGLLAAGAGSAVAGDEDWTFGGRAVVAHPLGEFADRTGTPYGLGGHVAWGRPASALRLRFDVSALIRDADTKRVPVGPEGRAGSYEVRTTRSVVALGASPRLAWPRGPLRPYLTGFAGIQYLSAEISVRSGTPGPPFSNDGDVGFAYGGGGGVLVRLGRGGTALDLGARYLGGAALRDVRGREIVDAAGVVSGVAVDRGETKVNRVEFYLGVSGL
jgi:hypothetical protein